MANAIDLVVAQQALDQLKNLITQLDLVDAKMTAISANAITLAANAGKVTTPSGGGANASSNAGANAGLTQASTLNKKLSDSISLLQARYTELTKATSTGTKTLLQEQVAIREKLRLATLVAKGVNDEVTAYQKLDAEYKKAVLAAKELGAVHGANSGVFIRESAQVNKLADELKAIDARIGSHTRSVGNYASGWNGLSNSINQLTREAPAFANSMQTGFMALSNNIPIFVDELENVRLKNIALAQSGQETKSVFSAVAGAFFSWQTLLSVGVTLVTIYGAQLIELMKGAGSAKAAIDRLNKAQEKSNELFRLGDDAIDHQIFMMKEKAKQAGKSQNEIDKIDEKGSAAKLELRIKERDRLQEEFDLATKAREIGAKQLDGRYQDQLVRYFSNRRKMRSLSKEDAAEAKQNKELERMADLKSLGATEKERLIVLANSSDEAYNVLRQKLAVAQGLTEQSGASDSEMREANRTKRMELDAAANKKMTDDELKAEEERLALLAEMKRKEIELEIAKIGVLLNDNTQYYTDRLHQLDLDFIKRSELEKLNTGEELRLAGTSYESQQIALLNSHIVRIGLIEDYNNKKKKLEALDLDPITQLATSGLEDKDPLAYLKKSAKNAVKNIKTPATELKETWKDTFNEIANAAQKAGDIIEDFSKRNFENEYRRLEDQKDIALKFAGESDFAKKQIEEQAEKRRKEIANRENRAAQKQAIFNIAIDTAQAVIATLKKTGFLGIPLSVIVGALGAAQIAVVASQKIPQYFEGGTHDGGLMMVNDAKGSSYKETIVTPDGKIIKPQGRDVLMNAPKGTEIYTPEQWQEKELHNMLQSKGVTMNESYRNNSGLTYQEMDAILGKHFKNITTQTTTFDKKGFSSYSVSKGNKTIRNENRASGQGFKV